MSFFSIHILMVKRLLQTASTQTQQRKKMLFFIHKPAIILCNHTKNNIRGFQVEKYTHK